MRRSHLGNALIESQLAKKGAKKPGCEGEGVEEILEAYRVARANLRTLIIKTTNKCNLSCTHCSPDSGPTNQHAMTSDYLKGAIRQFADLGGTTLILGGGEPFTRSDLVDVIMLAHELGLAINVETNGTMISQDIVRRLVGVDVTFIISLDGIRPETHDGFRRFPGAFKRTLDTIEHLARADFHLRITTVLNRKNAEEIPEIIAYCLDKMGIEHRLLPIISEGGRGSSAEARHLALTPSQVKDYLEKCYLLVYRRYKAEGKAKMLMVDLPRALIPAEISTFSTCAWGIGMVGLSHNGDVGLCHYSTDERPYIAGSLREKSLAELWFEHQNFEDLRGINVKTLKGICSNCVHARRCRGLCRLSAYHKYREIHAPYPVCQDFYEQGLFPRESMVDPERDCHYIGQIPPPAESLVKIQSTR
jgi:radical SAM protein with 4Fe4S-binding SPASM domain